ncbi:MULTISPECIES: hypothetical protein [unclassified Campylobacter]|uniref:hypothetical protein n=1 Tax=unclassified Campylobacter TaxID=2593542 RepID=UPI003D340E6D
MASLSESIVSVVELVEAQATDIRQSFTASADALLIKCVVAVLAVVGFVFLLLGANLFFAKFLGDINGYFATSGLAFLISFILYKVAKCKAK